MCQHSDTACLVNQRHCLMRRKLGLRHIRRSAAVQQCVENLLHGSKIALGHQCLGHMRTAHCPVLGVAGLYLHMVA